MKYAILGAGFAGCSTAYFLSDLLKKGKGPFSSLTLIDPFEGKSASSVAAGSLHPFTGVRARLSWQGREAFQEAKTLIEAVSQRSAEKVILSKEVLRLAATEEQASAFQKSAFDYPENRWLQPLEVQEREPFAPLWPALSIRDALAVNCRAYLKGLLALLEESGVLIEAGFLSQKEAFKRFDAVILATGANTAEEESLKQLAIRPIKGQLLLFDSQEIAAPKALLSGDKYLAPHEERGVLIGGATFERAFSSLDPDLEKAKAEILPRLFPLFPPLKKAPILGCQAALRAYRPNKLPVIGRLKEKLYLFTGLGSKGLLYHAYLGKMLAEAIASGDFSKIPKEVSLPLP